MKNASSSLSLALTSGTPRRGSPGSTRSCSGPSSSSDFFTCSASAPLLFHPLPLLHPHTAGHIIRQSPEYLVRKIVLHPRPTRPAEEIQIFSVCRSLIACRVHHDQPYRPTDSVPPPYHADVKVQLPSIFTRTRSVRTSVTHSPYCTKRLGHHRCQAPERRQPLVDMLVWGWSREVSSGKIPGTSKMGQLSLVCA